MTRRQYLRFIRLSSALRHLAITTAHIAVALAIATETIHAL